jgi:putative oxidoreductase
VKNNFDFKMDIPLLILRVGIGIMFVLHGYPKFMGGIEKWTGLGHYGMGSIGIDIFPVFWGFMAAFSEFVGGIMIIVGLYLRYFSFLLFVTMSVATVTHLSSGDGIMGASHAIESAVVFLCLLFAGPGKYSLQNR